jgi:1-acyl-sn-glycerol-3-phosphate acyltransferase
MDKLLRPFRVLYRWLFFAMTFITLMPLFPFFYVCVQHERLFPIAMFLKRVWAHMMTWPMGIITLTEVEEELGPGPYMIILNHTSFLDIMQAYIALPVYFHFVGRSGLGRWWFFNIFFKKMDILIDRDNARASYITYQRVADDLKKGISVGIFPEAIIPADTPKMLPFKNAPFKVAIEQQVPILPVTFVGGWKVLPAKPHVHRGGRPGITRVKVHRPIPTAGLTQADTETLRDRVRGIIADELAAHGYGQ